MYIESLDRIKLIEADELQQLFERAHVNYNGDAERALIAVHLRYVVNIARDYLKYDLPFADLIQEGNIGLIKALRKFKPGGGARFISFAIRSINLEICGFVLDSWSVVAADVTKEQVRLFMRMRRFKPNRVALSAAEIKDVAARLRVPLSEVLRLENRLRGVAVPLDAADLWYEGPAAAGDSMTDEYDHVAAAEEMNWSARRMNYLRLALASLDERSRDVINRRWLLDGRKTGFREISKKYNVSGERIRQIQRRAFGIMRAIVP